MVRSKKVIAIAQLVHLLIFMYVASILFSIFYGHEDGLVLLVLWGTIPVYIAESILVWKFGGMVYDHLLPFLTIVVLFLPPMLQMVLPEVSSEFIRIMVAGGVIVVIVLNLGLLFVAFKELGYRGQ